MANNSDIIEVLQSKLCPSFEQPVNCIVRLAKNGEEITEHFSKSEEEIMANGWYVCEIYCNSCNVEFIIHAKN